MRQIKLLIIHCSDSPNGKNFTIDDIDDWHQARGFRRDQKWRDRFNPALSSVGYHHVIRVDGTVEDGRHHEEIGAHCVGFNSSSIGICMVGRDAFSMSQWAALACMVKQLQLKCPGITIRGHCQLTTKKTCPNFDVTSYVDGGLMPLRGCIYGGL